jgi:hypothetical protein
MLKSVFVVSSFSLRHFVRALLSTYRTPVVPSNAVCIVMQPHTVIFLRISTAYIPMSTLVITELK